VRTSLIYISPSSWTIFHSFESILEWELSVGLEYKFNVLCKHIASEKYLIWYELYLKEYLIAKGNSSSDGLARVKRERRNSRKRLLRMIVFDWGHLRNERARPDVERKYMDTDKVRCKEPELTTLIREVGGGTNIQSKLTIYNINRNRRHGLNPLSTSAIRTRAREHESTHANFSVIITKIHGRFLELQRW